MTSPVRREKRKTIKNMNRQKRRQIVLSENSSEINNELSSFCQGLVLSDTIKPRTENQHKALLNWEDGRHLLLYGIFGTGKTFLALWLACRTLIAEHYLYEKIYIVRSSQATKDMGFQPGDDKEKMAVFEPTYAAIIAELFGFVSAYNILKRHNKIEFVSTAFLRGRTLSNCIIILDEFQNLSFHEARTVLSRVGDNTRLIISGDTRQDDLTNPRYKEESGSAKLLQVCSRIGSIAPIQFNVSDIVRSGFCRELAIALNELNY